MAAFAPVLLAPGYCLAWACDCFGFRKRPFEERLAWGITLSFGVVPIVAVEFGKYASLNALCRLASLCAVAFLAIAALDILRRQRRNAIRYPILGAGITAG